MTTASDVIGISRSNQVERLQERHKKPIGRPPLQRRLQTKAGEALQGAEASGADF